METTSNMDAAVEQLLQVPDTPSEGNLDASVDEILDPTQDESEEIEAAEAEDADNEIELDAEYDDDDLVEASDTANLITVKVNGKEENWTLDQLKQSAAGQGYINQRMQEVAKLEKQYKAQSDALTQQQQQVLALYQQAQQGGVQKPTPPSKELFDTDPLGYMEAKIQFDDQAAQYNAHLRQIQAMQQQQAQATQAQRQQHLQHQAEVLKERLPEIADPQKSEAIKASLMETGDYYGFTEQEMGAVTDARYILALNDAAKYRALVNKRAKATSQPSESLTPVKAGAKKRSNSGKTATRKKAQQRLQKSGSINDALGLILNS